MAPLMAPLKAAWLHEFRTRASLQAAPFGHHPRRLCLGALDKYCLNGECLR